jgi:hypothetical protein
MGRPCACLEQRSAEQQGIPFESAFASPFAKASSYAKASEDRPAEKIGVD